MKYLAVLLGLIAGLIAAKSDPSPTPTPTPIQKPKLIKLGESEYTYSLVEIKTKTALRLIANFDHKNSFANLVQTHECQTAISGGFYDTNSRPLGWWTNNLDKYYPPRENKLFNGFVWQTSKNQVQIGRTPPDAGQVTWGFQTGPLLFESGQPQTLRLANDKLARRLVWAINSAGNSLWLVIYDPNSVFDGPKLADLPEIIQAISRQENLTLETAVNLDGGTASAFHSPKKTLYEFNPVGSVLCAG